MADTTDPITSQRVYRVDRFVVPHGARAEFIEKVRDTHSLLRTLPGFVQELLLERSAGPDGLQVVTVVEWESPEAMERAKAFVGARHAERGFSPQEMLPRLGIRAELATYDQLSA